MKKIRLFVVLIGCVFIALNQMKASSIATDGMYKIDETTGITCENLWINDRIHTPETFENLPFVKEAGTKARTAVVDVKNGKIYIGYSKPIVVNSESNDYAYLEIFDLETGAYERELALTCDGAPITGTLCVSQVGLDDAGNLWFCGMYSDVSANPAQIYVVEDIKTGACKNVGEWKLPDEERAAAGRCDYWDVVGDITGKTSNAVCMAAVGTTTSGEKHCLYRWELAQGTTKWVANEDDFAGYVSYYGRLSTYPTRQTTWGASETTVRIVAEEGHIGSLFYVDGFTTCPSLYQTSLSMLESFASATDLAPKVGCNGVNEFVLGEIPFIAYVEAQYDVSPGCRVNVCQLGEGMAFEGMRKLWSLPEGGLGEVSDGGNHIHSIDIYPAVDENGKEGVYLLTYKVNNGLGLYLIAEDGFVGPNNFSNNGVLYRIDPNTNKVSVIGAINPIDSSLEILETIEFNGKSHDVTSISSCAFKNCSNLKSIVIPNSVVAIGDCAFQGCSGLTSITIPNSVTSIGNEAFAYCTGLKTVFLEDGEGVITGLKFQDSPIENLYLGRNTSSLFLSSTNKKYLKSVIIGDYIASISSSVFENCSNLRDITIPNSVTSIGTGAFSGCTALSEVNFNAENCTYMGSADYPVFKDCPNLKTINIGESVKTIPSYAFTGCNILSSVTIPNSVTLIGASAFMGCTALTEVNFNAENCTYMGSADYPVFKDCPNLKTINIGESVKTIPSYAFTGCNILSSVTIPNSVTLIGASAFMGCTALTEVNFNAENCTSMSTVDAPVFKDCLNLKTINIGNSVKSIPSYAFYGCSGLAELTIPSTDTWIGDKVFWGCNKLIESEVIDRSQTTVSIAVSSLTKYQTGITTDKNENILSESNNVLIKGLKPNTKYTYNSSLKINDTFCEINSFAFTTKDMIFKNSDVVGATSFSSKAYYEGDVTVLEYGINWGNENVVYNNVDSISVCNLNPNTTYKVYYFLNTQEGGEYTTSWNITTKSLTWNTGEFTATSTSSARISVETNCVATDGTGFEWKRYDAPESLAPSKAPCPIVDGKLIGSLRGLNSSAYYNCRPYYTSSTGKTYYGKWFTIFTGDANVYFEPEVSTSDKNTVVDNSAVINGYALAGSDDILEQGFEYWKTSSSPTTYSSSGVMIAKASGISMSATIANLEYNSTYRYRAYVKTSKGSFYGSEKELIIGDPAGVGYIESDVKDAEEVARYDIHGRRLNKPTKGINIIKMSNGTTRKEIIKE